MKNWIISLAGESERVKLKAFSREEDAIAEMQYLYETIGSHLRHTNVELEQIDDLLVLAYYSEDETLRYEKAVMTEVDFAETPAQKQEPGNSKLIDNSWQYIGEDCKKLPW